MTAIEIGPWPSSSEDEVEAVVDVLQSNRVNYWTGDVGRRFEEEFAEFAGTQFAVAVANGTLALEVALRAANVGAGHEVIVSPRSFVASAACVVAVGATPVFADVARESQNITAQTISAVLTRRAKAIICVHLGGLPCEMDEIMRLADDNGITVIEDCAQAHGALYRGRSVGSIGHIGAWSFCQDKILTTGGEGGMVTTSDRDLWSRMWSYKDHGKSWEGVYERKHDSSFPWRHDTFGSNYRMLELQAAIGCVQLRKLDQWVKRRRENAAKIAEALVRYPSIRLLDVPDYIAHAYYRFDVFVRAEKLAPGWTRDSLVTELSARGVPVSFGACPEIYRERCFSSAGLGPETPLVSAKRLGETCVQFLVHPTISDSQMMRICGQIDAVMQQADGT